MNALTAPTADTAAPDDTVAAPDMASPEPAPAVESDPLADTLPVIDTVVDVEDLVTGSALAEEAPLAPEPDLETAADFGSFPDPDSLPSLQSLSDLEALAERAPPTAAAPAVPTLAPPGGSLAARPAAPAAPRAAPAHRAFTPAAPAPRTASPVAPQARPAPRTPPAPPASAAPAPPASRPAVTPKSAPPVPRAAPAPTPSAPPTAAATPPRSARAAPAPMAQAKIPPSARFDAKFIEDYKLLDRYLENKLPFKGARDLENWCRAHPEYLEKLKLAERAQASLKLLEASGQPQDLTEPAAPWWRSIYVLIGLAVVAFLSLMGFWAVMVKYMLVHGELAEARALKDQGSLVQPAVQSTQRIAPDRAPGINRARIVVSRAAPQLIDLHIDMTYTQKVMLFRVTVDKQDQGRALILNNLLKDSNNDLRVTLNTTGLATGIYSVRIEALPLIGGVPPQGCDGWLILEVK
ncbi:MAG TPA: hypothetical protein VK437_00325 [Steroidobacteraceae bacterium]|nr:hypothetical protein [Steroidobacteraceae bacterium]